AWCCAASSGATRSPRCWGATWATSGGGDKVVLGSALGWSLLTLYTPEATRWNLATLLVARILLGAFQGLHFPAMSSIIVNHLRPQERTFFTSVVAAGPSCGLLFIGSVGSMAMVSHGWPVVFKLTGMLGIGWCFGLAYLMHRHGSQPGKASRAAPKVASAPAFRVPWIAYFRSPSFWSLRDRNEDRPVMPPLETPVRPVPDRAPLLSSWASRIPPPPGPRRRPPGRSSPTTGPSCVPLGSACGLGPGGGDSAGPLHGEQLLLHPHLLAAYLLPRTLSRGPG
ncbi:unnamed protein product, partial [Ixodes pacificus]